MKRSISIPTDTLWQAGFLLLPPLTAAWLMQFTYGVLPWAMPFPALLANALCIALLYWPLCGLTGRIAPCCIGHPHRRWCVGRGQLLCPVLPGAPPSCPGISPPWAPPPMWRGATALRPRGRWLRPSPWRRPWVGVPPSGETQGPPAPHRNAAAPAAGVPGGRGWPASCSCSPPAAGAFRVKTV